MIQVIFDMLQKASQLASKHPIITQQVIRSLPVVVREIDSWISSASYTAAVEKVAELDRCDGVKLADVYARYSRDMSPGVRRAFEEALRRRGAL